MTTAAPSVPSGASPHSPRLRVGIVPLANFTLLPYAGFIDVLRLAADEGDRSRQQLCRWSLMSAAGEPVRASCGTRVQPDSALGDPRGFHYIVVVGGLLQDEQRAGPQLERFLREADAAGIPLIGLCTAVFTLMRLGLMSGRECCVSWYHFWDLKREFPDVKPVADRLFVVDGPRITCAGGTAAVDVAAWLVEQHIGHAEAEKALHILLADHARPADAPQPRLVPEHRSEDERLQRAIELIEENLAEPPGMDFIAARVGLSRRQLERLFRRGIGMTPFEYALGRRLHQGHWLLTRTRRPITDIAHACGFADGSHFARHFRAAFGASPHSVRAGGDAAALAGP